MWEKTAISIVSILFIIIIYSLRLVQMYNIINMKAPTCKRQRPLISWHPLEGSYNPLNSFTNSYRKESPTPLLQGYNPQLLVDHFS